MQKHHSLFWMALTVLATALGASAPATASNALREPIVGVASVVDGDTLEVHGQRIRLWGLDAPEASQWCERPDRSAWRCGATAANQLSGLIGRRSVACTPKGVDRYKRVIAACKMGAIDINAWLVTNGWALAYTRYSKAYVNHEINARRARAGIHVGTFVTPWEYRASRRN